MTKYVKSGSDNEPNLRYGYGKYLKPKKCFLCNFDDFRELFGHEIAKYSTEYGDYESTPEHIDAIECDCDGIYFCGVDTVDAYDIIGDLLGVNITSIHIDELDPDDVWICYK